MALLLLAVCFLGFVLYRVFVRNRKVEVPVEGGDKVE
jgi:hypothetical protein